MVAATAVLVSTVTAKRMKNNMYFNYHTTKEISFLGNKQNDNSFVKGIYIYCIGGISMLLIFSSAQIRACVPNFAPPCRISIS
jgi:hypothetical protein